MANAIPNYEVKINMNPSVVLNSSNDLKSSIKGIFNMPDSVTKIAMNYLDSSYLDLNDYGWDVRVRKMEGKDAFEFDYKKRYPISNGDIDTALSTAALDGFDYNENDYKSQVDWGYSKQTLSFSDEKDISISGYSGMTLPTNGDCRKYASNNVPGKLDKETDYTAEYILNNAHVYGPVTGKRSEGTWEGVKFYIEVYKIINEYGTAYDYVVEASFKVDDRYTAGSMHDDLIAYFNSQGWLLPEDILKTQLILSRY